MSPMHAVQNGWHVYPLKQWLKINRPLDNCTLYLGNLDSDATKTSLRQLTELGHDHAVSRTAVGDCWRVTLKRTVKRRIVVMLTLDDSKQLQAVIVLLSSSLSSKCTKTCAYGIFY